MKKILQPLISLSILLITWKIFKIPFPGWVAFEKWSAVPAIFWTLCGIEAIFMTWWLAGELKLKYLRINPTVYLGWSYLIIAAVLHLTGFKIMALVMTMLAALPLAVMGLFLLVMLIVRIFGGPIRWN